MCTLFYCNLISRFSTVFIASVQCNLIADTRPSYVTKQEGETVDLLCTFGRSIERCDFDMPSGQRIKLNPNVAERDGFSYYGEGFERGQCGLTITKLSKEHEGNFTCRLDLGIESEDAVGMIQVSIAKPPRDLDMKVSDLDRLQANQELYAECKFRDGRPQARILWYLGSDLINSQNQQTDELHDPDDEGLVSSRITHILRPEDNLKLLICRLEQSALENGFTNVTTQLDVKYQPMALSREELHIPGLQIGSNVDIKVLIRANPRPHLRWTIDGVDVRVGDQNRKYDASDAIRVEDGRWEAKLTVAALTLEDTLKTYTLRAENGIGNHMDYAIRIGGSPDIEGNLFCFNSISIKLIIVDL